MIFSPLSLEIFHIFFPSLVVQLIWKLMMFKFSLNVENCARESVADILRFNLATKGSKSIPVQLYVQTLYFNFLDSIWCTNRRFESTGVGRKQSARHFSHSACIFVKFRGRKDRAAHQSHSLPY